MRPTIAIQIVEDHDRAVAALQRDARVNEIHRNNGELLVTLHDPAMHHHFLIELLVTANVRMNSISPQQLKLEDVFLRLTKGMVQ